jgi:AraC-like DNA-binding protein
MFRMRNRIYQTQMREAAARSTGEGPACHEQGEEELCQLQQLARAFESGDRQAVINTLERFLGDLFLTVDGNVNRARNAVLMLLSFLFRNENGHTENWHARISLYEQRLGELTKLDTVESVCAWTENLVVKHFESSCFHAASPGVHTLSDRILAWMRQNYSRRITISQTADAVGASSSSVIHRLKRETGKTFAQNLAFMRICEAKRLLAYTSLNMGEIASRCGFSDQSYFTKVFKKHVNMTPRQFRDMLMLTPQTEQR